MQLYQNNILINSHFPLYYYYSCILHTYNIYSIWSFYYNFKNAVVAHNQFYDIISCRIYVNANSHAQCRSVISDEIIEQSHLFYNDCEPYNSSLRQMAFFATKC